MEEMWLLVLCCSVGALREQTAGLILTEAKVVSTHFVIYFSWPVGQHVSLNSATLFFFLTSGHWQPLHL